MTSVQRVSAVSASGGTAVVVASQRGLVAARSTVRSVLDRTGLDCLVVGIDGAYPPTAHERVTTLAEAVNQLDVSHEATVAAGTLETAEFIGYAQALGASLALESGSRGVIVLGAGVVVLDELAWVLDDHDGPVFVPHVDALGALRRVSAGPLYERRKTTGGWPSLEVNDLGSLHSRELFTVRTADQAASLRTLAADWRIAGRALDVLAVSSQAVVVHDRPLLVSPWHAIGATGIDADDRLCVDGQKVTAVDLTSMDPHRPWVLDVRAPLSPRVLLSQHPQLARLVDAEASARRSEQAALASSPEDGVTPRDGSPRLRVDPILRNEVRRAQRAGEEIPDVLGLGAGPDLDAWAAQLIPAGDPTAVARYLAAFRAARPRLQQRFPRVPGEDTVGFAEWALGSDAGPSVDSSLLRRSAQATLDALGDRDSTPASRSPGVNLVGYLSGELGVGESARLVDLALRAVGVKTSTFDVSGGIRSRQGASYRTSDPVFRETSLLCVNGAEVPAVVRRLGDLVSGSRVIGMWYWELEDFPSLHHVGFKHVDEVWAATDFMRDAIARHAGSTPVRTVTPPLPQAGPDPGKVPAHFGIPTDRPWFLFTFDFLSLAPRKNPEGLLDAFTRAFADRKAEDRPLLVIKTINADKQPIHAERLRLQTDGRGDVMILDTYLDNDERHVLVANCTCFVSLHRAEGLGLTVAEAMAWGKPVITTAYGGVMQFCNDRNSFLVDWDRGYVPETSGPYTKGMPWAEPDLEQAADYMRTVMDDRERARKIGDQAATDIRTLHNPKVAGARMLEALGTATPPGTSTKTSAGPRTRFSRIRRSLAGRLHRQPAQSEGRTPSTKNDHASSA